MFNYFKSEKQRKEQELKQQNDEKYKQLEKLRKSKAYFILENLPVLVNKYENRIKNFIFEMASSPIKIKNYIVTFMRHYYKEENHYTNKI